MLQAKIFGESDDRLVSALDIKKGIISKDYEFVDPEYEFKVRYVSGAKNNGAPHFRLYLSREDYKKLTPERKRKYDILCNMRHFKQSAWHREWEGKLSLHMEIEKYIKNPETNKYKRADAYYKAGNTIVELQHSYLDDDFNIRNEFYFKLGLNTVWLFDLTKSSINEADGIIEILEDNSKGFFRVCEECVNIGDYPVYIQVKGGLIYRVYSLERLVIDNEYKSTVRYFEKREVFTEDEFIIGIINKKDCFYRNEFLNKPKSIFEIYQSQNTNKLLQLFLENVQTNEIIKVFKDEETGRLREDYITGGISYFYCYLNEKTNNYNVVMKKFYSLSKSNANKRIWKLLGTVTRVL